MKDKKLQKATFAGGCFWCLEAIFKRTEGVENVKSGYTGGNKENPTYEDVCAGDSGHAEAVEITYDPGAITYEMLLQIFFESHNPTTLNRQGADIGSQYRSAVFYHNEEQKNKALKVIDIIEGSGFYPDRVVTEVAEAGKFYEAERYHNDYFSKNNNAPYCQIVIAPKLDSIIKKFKEVKEKD